jgi:O-antigen ligase
MPFPDPVNATMPVSRRVEFALLALLAFSLPLAEAPKNILAVLYLVTWLANRTDGDWGGPWRHWDTLFLAWGLSGYLIAPFAGLQRNEWAGAHDLPRIAFICWIASRGRYSGEAWRTLVAVIAASTALALAQGMWRLHVSKTFTELELESVGHVNHSAIYLSIAFGAAFAGCIAAWRGRRHAASAGWAALALFFFAGVIDCASRGAFAVSVVLAVLLAAAALHRSRWRLATIALLGAICAAIVLSSDLEIGRKQQRNAEAKNLAAFRMQIWDRGLLAWRHMPLAGVGLENFGQITDVHVQGWLAADGKAIDTRAYLQNSHGHSLYVNTLVERGVVGSLPVALLIVAWAVLLARTRPGPASDESDFLVWGASFSGWFVVVAGGLINTTLHHEHGLLAAILLGMHLAYCRRTSRPAGP